MLITEFFANREIFVTGGTGFLGKSLIEKLLRDCRKIKVIYILIRAKRTVAAELRLEEFKKNKVFDRINKECPEVLNKLHAIEGDSQELNLGLKPSDMELLKNVSVIFHMAANVKFDNPLRSSILLNTRGTHELVKIAEKLNNLVVFVHCSTAYCNPFEDVVEERVYKMPNDWRSTIKMAENFDEYTLNALYPKYTGYFPNTYAFTKNLSEQIIQEYSNKLPMIIIRPSVVLNAYREPVPGWIDNMNGPLGAMVGQSIGILPMIYGKYNIKLDCIPIDMITKLTIVASYKRALQTLRKEPTPSGLEVFNCAVGDFFDIRIGTFMLLYKQENSKNPMENAIWHYEAPVVTSCYYNFLLNILALNIPISLVLDNISRLIGREPILLKIVRRVVYSMKAVAFFTFKDYKILTKNTKDLEKYIPESELDSYGVLKEAFEFDFYDFLKNEVLGVKYNLFDQPMVASDAARKRFKILVLVNRCIKFVFFTLFVYYLWSILSN